VNGHEVFNLLSIPMARGQSVGNVPHEIMHSIPLRHVIKLQQRPAHKTVQRSSYFQRHSALYNGVF